MGTLSDLDDRLLAAPHYYWACCMVCRKVSTSQEPLLRCMQCKSISYCSKEHQKQHWKKHKTLCSYLATAADEVGAESFFGQSADDAADESQEEDDTLQKWRKFRVNAIKTSEILMNRKLDEWEKEMFLFPKACRKCFKSQISGMIDCQDCMNVSYCCDQCQEEDRECHALLCEELKFAMVCDNFECSVSIAAPPLPSEIDQTVQPLPRDMKCFMELNSQSEPSGMAEMEQRFLSNLLSGPLTILHVAQTHHLSNDRLIEDQSELTLHIVGADVMEMLGIIKWEYILHRLPKCTSMRVIFVGPDLENEEEGECQALGACQDCSDQGKTMTYEMRCQLYKEFARSSHYKTPDMVICFNCGFHEFESQPERDTWAESLPFLTQHVGVPVLFTSYNLTEAKRDFSSILKSRSDLQVKAAKVKNPFQSWRPHRDFEMCQNKDIFYANQYFSVVKRQSEQQ